MSDDSIQKEINEQLAFEQEILGKKFRKHGEDDEEVMQSDEFVNLSDLSAELSENDSSGSSFSSDRESSYQQSHLKSASGSPSKRKASLLRLNTRRATQELDMIKKIR